MTIRVVGYFPFSSFYVSQHLAMIDEPHEGANLLRDFEVPNNLPSTIRVYIQRGRLEIDYKLIL